jgi:hypothetical protein
MRLLAYLLLALWGAAGVALMVHDLAFGHHHPIPYPR